MWSWIYQLASPKKCYRFCLAIQPWLLVFFLFLAALGLVGALWLAPPDYQQGDAYRIAFIHVPAAILSLFVYLIMSTAVIIHFIWKIKVADMVAKSSASLGALFTFITLVTGSLWGQPTWGTFWIWDARLTSELILLFIYFGIISVRQAIPDSTFSAKISGVVTLIGLVNIPIIHYSVIWWNTLHQGATILQFAKPTIPLSMLWPLLVMIAAYFFYYMWALTIKIRQEIFIQEKKTQWIQELAKGNNKC